MINIISNWSADNNIADSLENQIFINILGEVSAEISFLQELLRWNRLFLIIIYSLECKLQASEII